jgi:acylphosphatase
VTQCLRCHVSGRVQGVWFRAATQEQARRLGLNGHAHNLADGRVEVLACGEQEALAMLNAWLWQGPSGARVDKVECVVVEGESPLGFTSG